MKLQSLYPAASAAVVLATIAALAILVRQPWLFPSLGPTIFLHAVNPDQPASKPWNTLAGHAVGAVAASLALVLCGATGDPSAMTSGMLTPARAVATVLATGATVGVQQAIRAQHAPAIATVMLLTLGGLKPTTDTAVALIAGVVLATALGELVRRFHPATRTAAAGGAGPA